MADPRGLFRLKHGDRELRLWLGMSVLAELQAKHGRGVLEQMQAPENAGPNWIPPLQIVVDLFLGALQRYHSDEADRYLVDELLAENPGAYYALLQLAFPDQGEAKGNGKRPKRAA